MRRKVILSLNFRLLFFHTLLFGGHFVFLFLQVDRKALFFAESETNYYYFFYVGVNLIQHRFGRILGTRKGIAPIELQ